jgi:lysozyme
MVDRVNNYKISQEGINLIKKWEGSSPVPYICPAGYKTIGIGHVIRTNESYQRPLTSKEIEELFRKDILIFEGAVNNYVKVPIKQNQFDALVSFVFNVGINAFRNSTMLKLINSKKLKEAGEQFTRWVYANGKVLEGLRRRREDEKQLFLRGL